MSLLTSSRAYADVKMGRQCVDQIVLLDEDISAGYVLMSNICTETDSWEELESFVDFSTVTMWKRVGEARASTCSERFSKSIYVEVDFLHR